VIAASLLLILVAVALLVAGVVGSANALIVCSIISTVLAAIVLVAGVRQGPPVEPDTDPDLTGGQTGRLTPPAPLPLGADRGADGPNRPAGYGYAAPTAPARDGRTMVEDPATRGGIPTQFDAHERDPDAVGDADPYDTADQRSGDDPYDQELFDRDTAGVADRDGSDDEDPPDEPAAQVVPAPVAAAVAGLDVDVLVVDGRPRYHLETCEHLIGREGEPIPVSEAIELGFTPCGLCEPDTALVDQARDS